MPETGRKAGSSVPAEGQPGTLPGDPDSRRRVGSTPGGVPARQPVPPCSRPPQRRTTPGRFYVRPAGGSCQLAGTIRTPRQLPSAPFTTDRGDATENIPQARGAPGDVAEQILNAGTIPRGCGEHARRPGLLAGPRPVFTHLQKLRHTSPIGLWSDSPATQHPKHASILITLSSRKPRLQGSRPATAKRAGNPPAPRGNAGTGAPGSRMVGALWAISTNTGNTGRTSLQPLRPRPSPRARGMHSATRAPSGAHVGRLATAPRAARERTSLLRPRVRSAGTGWFSDGRPRAGVAG